MFQHDNLKIWNSVDTTDPNYTKGFNRGGGFKGTSTNSTYLAKKATNLFGPIGIGWGYNVIDETYQPGPGQGRHPRPADQVLVRLEG